MDGIDFKRKKMACAKPDRQGRAERDLLASSM